MRKFLSSVAAVVGLVALAFALTVICTVEKQNKSPCPCGVNCPCTPAAPQCPCCTEQPSFTGPGACKFLPPQPPPDTTP
jgi:hypothetical protein